MYVSVDVDLECVIAECSNRDKEWLLSELLQELEDDVIIKILAKQKMPRAFIHGNESCVESEFQESLEKLSNAYMSLSSEECSIITNLAKKY
jgi:hypothetical protein